MKRFIVQASVLTSLLLGCSDLPRPLKSPATTTSIPDASSPSSDVDPWDNFWRERGVTAPPPRGFLDDPGADQVLPIRNLTEGLINDETALSWVKADLRRARGDNWAFCHLQLDIVNAGLFGPPGLNGTDKAIAVQQSKGVVEIQVPAPLKRPVALAVIAIPKDLQSQFPSAGLTDFAIVLVRESTGVAPEAVFSDGHRERLGQPKAGEISWQLDTGEMRENSTIGPIWYQARGYSCQPDGKSVIDHLCRQVQP